MQKSTNLEKKRVSCNSNTENITREISKETPINTFKKETSNGGSLFSNLFQRLTCSSTKLTDDESQAIVIPEPKPK